MKELGVLAHHEPQKTRQAQKLKRLLAWKLTRTQGDAAKACSRPRSNALLSSISCVAALLLLSTHANAYCAGLHSSVAEQQTNAKKHQLHPSPALSGSSVSGGFLPTAMQDGMSWRNGQVFLSIFATFRKRDGTFRDRCVGVQRREQIHMKAPMILSPEYALNLAQKAFGMLVGSIGMTSMAAVAAVLASSFKFFNIRGHQDDDKTVPPMISAQQKFTQSRYQKYPNGNAVNRSDVSEQISSYLEANTGQYLLILGPRGAGKTHAVTAALNNRQGVVQLTLADSVGVNSLYSKVLQMANFGTFSSMTELEEKLMPFMQGAAKLYRAAQHDDEEGFCWLPTLYVDVADGTAPWVAQSALKVVKRLVVDERAVRAVVVLSDPHSVMTYVGDEDRQQLLWVGDLKEVEAREYLDNRGCLCPADAPGLSALRHAVLKEVGTRPSTLARICDLVVQPYANATDIVHTLVEQRQRNANLAVDALIAVDELECRSSERIRGLCFRRLLLQMLKAPGQSIRCEDAHYMAPPANVIDVLSRRGHDAIVYNAAARAYEFNTRAHWRAAERMLGATLEAEAADRPPLEEMLAQAAAQ